MPPSAMRASTAGSATGEPQAQPEQQQQLQSGRFYFKDGSIYEGEYKLLGVPPPDAAAQRKPAKPRKDEEQAAQPAEPKPVRHGTGTLQCGAYAYTGGWVDDEMHGAGRFTFASGAAFEGSFERGKFAGRGRYDWPDGRSYEGAWVDNMMHGSGVFTDAEGHAWAGQFYAGAGPGLTCWA